MKLSENVRFRMILPILCLIFLVCTEARICPDKANKCPDWATCCQYRDGGYGCCPFRNAECCLDFIHCCPHGTYCNLRKSSCDSLKASSLTFQWMVLQYHPNFITDAFDDPQISETELDTLDLQEDSCPDGTPCKGRATCCSTGGKNFGCCLYPNADCCADNIHCCPDGYKCDLNKRQCTKESDVTSEINGSNLPIFNLEKNVFEVPFEKLCGPSNSCYLSGEVCCTDGNNEFCCPKGSTCLPESKSCKMNDSEDSNHFFFKAATNLEEVENKFIVCPDGKSYCPFETTCCLISPTKYRCCPMSEATCCPHDYECVGKDCERNLVDHLMHLPIFEERRAFDN